MLEKCISSEKWHFKYPWGSPLNERHAKLDIIDNQIKDEFLSGVACSLLTNIFDAGGKEYFTPEIFYCGVSIKDRHRKDNIHTDDGDRPYSIKILGLLNLYWEEDWGGGFFYDNQIVKLFPGDFCIFDPRIPHSAEEIYTDNKRFAIDFSVRSINSQ